MATTNEYLTELKALLDAETTKIAEQATVVDSVIALLGTLTTTNAALQQRILDLAIDPVVAQQIRDLFDAHNTAIQLQVDKLKAAVTTNT